MIASATACGSGNSRGPANCAPTYQAAISTASETNLSTTFNSPQPGGRRCRDRARAPGRPARCRRPRRARDTRRARRPPPRRAGGARCLRRSAGGRSRAPSGRRRRCAARAAAIRPRRRRGSPWPGASLRGSGRPRTGSWRPRRRRRCSRRSPTGPLGAELAHDVGGVDGAPVTLGFELGAEIPVGQRGVVLALQRLLRQQRRRPVDDRRLPPQIDAGAARQPLQQQPALVERAAGDGELLALEIGDRP